MFEELNYEELRRRANARLTDRVVTTLEARGERRSVAAGELLYGVDDHQYPFVYVISANLYEMLTGTLPFTASDPMEWVHCHIARQPVPPGARSKEVPAPISAIILQLLAKTGEERYQTAAGVEADLRRCLAEWEAMRRIDTFTLGEHDTSDRLLMPEKLHGRDREREALHAAFDQVVASGTPALVLVSGYSGIGKSSIVHELHKAIVLPRGIFISGKFDQYKRDIPYATLAQAFRTFVRQILSESEAKVDGWRSAISGAVDLNGQLIVNLLPEMEFVVGKQPPVAELPATEAESRFHMVFRSFLGVFADKQHPLAIFLDDLQWLDAATLKLLEHLITHPDVRHLLIIGAFRDNEVSTSHPLRLILALRGLTPAFNSFNDAQFDEARFEQHFEANPRLALPSRAAYLNAAPADQGPAHLEALAAHHRQLQIWAHHCPENFANRTALVRAEIARIEGRHLDAERLYEEAIRLARQHGFIHNEAIAGELTARFYEARGFETIAQAYLRNARYCYLRWGADGKVRQLDEAYPHLRRELSPHSEPRRFDLVLTDEMMPELTGTELAREIRQLRPEIPIILMSGYCDTQLSERAQAAGVIDVLRKPLVRRDIAEPVVRALQAHH